MTGRKVPWPVVRGILETITNSFFECSSSNGFAVDLANQTLPRKRRTYKAGALHVLLPSVSPPLDNLARLSATIMPRADYDYPFSTKVVNIDSSKSQLTDRLSLARLYNQGCTVCLPASGSQRMAEESGAKHVAFYQERLKH